MNDITFNNRRGVLYSFKKIKESTFWEGGFFNCGNIHLFQLFDLLCFKSIASNRLIITNLVQK